MVNCFKTKTERYSAGASAELKFSRHELFWSPLAAKIRLAELLFSRFGQAIRETGEVNSQLICMKESLAEVRTCMTELDLSAVCARCSLESVTGGCCSKFMAEENDAVLLMINLLAENELTENPQHDQECTFLGPRGCVLDYKPFFCLNYLCKRIRENSSPALLKNLEKATGALLQAQFAMEGMILSCLNQYKQPGCLY